MLQMYDSIATTSLVMIIAWLTASMFMEVFHMAIDTVLMCYITDRYVRRVHLSMPHHRNTIPNPNPLIIAVAL